MPLDTTKFINRFIEETREHCGHLAKGLAALDRDPTDKQHINQVFRAAHTIKGSSRMLKLGPITDTAHQLEEVLSALRDGSLRYSTELSRLLYRVTDSIVAMVEALTAGTTLPVPDAALRQLLAQAVIPDRQVTQQTSTITPINPVAAEIIHSAEFKSPDSVRVRLAKLDELIKLMEEVVSSHGRARQRVADVRALEHCRYDATQTGVANWHVMQAHLQQFTQSLHDDVLTQELLMDELHSKVLIMRMLPLTSVFDSVGSMLRELAWSMGKEVECVVTGADMELDRQMIDKLNEPLLHLVRNALDHGIEMPAQRLSIGKPGAGRISLSARQDGACVVIEIADDGAGIAVEMLRDKAIRKGILSPELAQVLTPPQVIDLIFLPGLSTSPIVTDISGRGVGMDVVKRCVVDELKGEINIESRPGRGTVFALRLPASLALMRVMQVGVAEFNFGFISQHVVELRQVSESDILTLAERRSVIIRNEFVPVADLASLLKLPIAEHNSVRKENHRLLLIVRMRDEKLALLVDDLRDERDMVIKPMPTHMRRFAAVSGVITTGKNELVNILHVPTLMTLARRAEGANPMQPAQRKLATEKLRVLVVDDSMNTREIEKDVLEAHGYQVDVAEDGLDGWRRAQTEQFDAVLTDVEMPTMDGFTLTARLRQDEKYRTTPIVIITSRAREEDKRRGIEVGADAYIVKTNFEQNNLIDILQNLLG